MVYGVVNGGTLQSQLFTSHNQRRKEETIEMEYNRTRPHSTIDKKWNQLSIWDPPVSKNDNNHKVTLKVTN